MDAVSTNPVTLMIFIPPNAKNNSNYKLILFDSKVGGRGVEIPTFTNGKNCIVFAITNNPHGSIYCEQCDDLFTKECG